MAAKRVKWSEAQVKTHIQAIQKVIEQGKRENKGEHFIGITREQISRYVAFPLILPENEHTTKIVDITPTGRLGCV